MVSFASLEPVKFNNWIIKASVFDEQILIFFLNTDTMSTHCRIFYDDNIAHLYIERLTKV